MNRLKKKYPECHGRIAHNTTHTSEMLFAMRRYRMQSTIQFFAKPSLMLALASLFMMETVAQTYEMRPEPVMNGEKVVRIPGGGIVYVPANLEVQSGAYRELAEAYKRNNGTQVSDLELIIQPKGVNRGRSSHDAGYMRVIIATDIETIGTYRKLSDPLTDMTKADLYYLQTYTMSMSAMEFKKKGILIKEIAPMIVCNVNGMYGVKLGYRRQWKTEPQVWVDQYWFENNDRTHYVTVSYRLSEQAIWKPILKRIISTLRFENH